MRFFTDPVTNKISVCVYVQPQHSVCVHINYVLSLIHIQLLEVSRALFINNVQHSAHGTSGTEVHQLLMILSDGRGVFAEGTLVLRHICVYFTLFCSQSIQLAVRKLQELGVFVVFVILDPLHKVIITCMKIPVCFSRVSFILQR